MIIGSSCGPEAHTKKTSPMALKIHSAFMTNTSADPVPQGGCTTLAIFDLLFLISRRQPEDQTCLDFPMLKIQASDIPATQPSHCVSFSIPFVPIREGGRSLANSRIYLSNLIGDDFSANKTEVIIAARQGF